MNQKIVICINREYGSGGRTIGEMLSEDLGISSLTEGVETEGQLSLLKDAGCDLVQGYYFSRPLPPQEFEKLIEKDIAIEKGRKK